MNARHASPYDGPYGGQYGGYENSRHAGAGFSGYGDYEEALDERWSDDRRHAYGASEERWGQIPNQFSPGEPHHRGSAHGAGRPVNARLAQRTQATTSSGSSTTSSGLRASAPTRSPWARSWVARRPPQNGHHRPVTASSGQVG